MAIQNTNSLDFFLKPSICKENGDHKQIKVNKQFLFSVQIQLFGGLTKTQQMQNANIQTDSMCN